VTVGENDTARNYGFCVGLERLQTMLCSKFPGDHEAVRRFCQLLVGFLNDFIQNLPFFLSETTKRWKINGCSQKSCPFGTVFHTFNVIFQILQPPG
jgi:hypothetical protein